LQDSGAYDSSIDGASSQAVQGAEGGQDTPSTNPYSSEFVTVYCFPMPNIIVLLLYWFLYKFTLKTVFFYN